MRRRVAVALVLFTGGIIACGDGDAVGVGESALDLTGNWALAVDGVCTGSISITQEDSAFDVTGSVGGGFCPFAANGSGSGILDGSSITFGIGFGSGSDESGTGLGSVDFDGTVSEDGDHMSGTYSNDSGLSGQWQATRQ